ncbi:cytochrome c [Uliginosibacterium sp. 31-16]|uniref:c-type cytochrome n=1 Tax=Uliginosibacterium sp. 31-16 TaxID=3068315 RepID=UPI00273E628B|nr:cytochrome c [Uliginosibacterium sp. 31-16]MDP5240205.1 cytochrome c [Uliginosibacterium sp. 31-16]
MKIKNVIVLVAASLGASAVLAQAKPEDQIKYRQAAMTVTARSVGVLNAMAKGDVPFNKDVAQRHAATIASLSDLPLAAGAYGPGTDKGAPTKADPKVWSEADKFKAAFDKFTLAARALPAASADQGTLKTALADLGKTCKGCHDDYRMK